MTAPVVDGQTADHVQLEFDAFHDAHPEVADHLERLARQWLHDHDRVAIGMLFEVVRWQAGLTHTDGQRLRLNNNHRSRYARLLIARHPAWDGRIYTRELTARWRRSRRY